MEIVGRTSGSIVAQLAVAVTLALSIALASATQAFAVSTTTLGEQGWSCFPAPPFVVPPRIVCATPGLGRPFPGAPDRPSYVFLAFDLDGQFMGTETLIRQDLYSGQPCGPSGEPWLFRAAIGY
jgi:hypothetical protein